MCEIATESFVVVAAAESRAYSNPLGVHSLVWCGEWDEAAARRAAVGSAAAGFNLVEIPAFDAARLDGRMTRRVLEEHGLAAATSLGLTLDSDISSEDKEVVARGVAALEDALRFSADAGARHMCGILYSALAKYPGPPTAAGRANAAAALRGLASKASDLGVALCLEVVNRYETNLLNTAAQAAAFVDEVDHPNVFIHLDTYHMHIEEVSMGAAVQAAGSRLRYIHMGESHRGYLGTGSVDFQGLFEALAAAGYAGPITFESFSSAVVSEQLSNTL
ncbi:D-tagatose 3-epimerase [Monoraphidium neglectum]|uniref:D-tagatose 3-epimerase n=1 Tax=Monoraphidium neglectum TaxID=145388 RepID=A0A0D2L0P2_9CHLO|nr:D-tagatose 3-epimerase [Monoraphidium neglectum]KIZ00974.1 D-tagatose 3-epimerase [Monoraphidium neglectum]|eukprot:XP_013899993.1 D-tagatose 3-epimerase [Monoraphidium neglectum]